MSKGFPVFVDQIKDRLKFFRNFLWFSEKRLSRSVKNKIANFQDGDDLSFTCNVCGKSVSAPIGMISIRECRSCHECGSTQRMRMVVHLLSMGLYGKSMATGCFPATKKLGMGMSDTPSIAVRLGRKLNYTNTFYHREPRLDITNLEPGVFGPLDFLISSDVFEPVFSH